jgi:hypothetical protein
LTKENPMSIRKYVPAAAALAATLLPLTGCSSTQPPADPAPSSSTTAPTAAPAPTTGTDGPTSGVSHAPPNGPATLSRCRTGDIRVTLMAAPGGGAMGSLYTWLVFTNTSAKACTLSGFPGVSYVTGASGQQVNDPATRSGTPSKVTLTPRQAAHAQLQTGHPEAYPDTCKPVQVAGYRVYLPDETAAVFVAAPMQQCSTKGVNATTVNPIVPGITE